MISYIEHKYDIGEIVYLITDVDQKPRMVYGFIKFQSEEIMYKLACGAGFSEHFEIELSKEKTTY